MPFRIRNSSQNASSCFYRHTLTPSVYISQSGDFVLHVLLTKHCSGLQGAAKGTLTVGDTVLFLTIMQQLYG